MSHYAQEYIDHGTERLGLHVYPEPDSDRPLVVLFPAMGVPARFYRSFAAELSSAGLWAVVADLRGTGTSTPRPSRASRCRYADLADDVGAVLDALKQRRAGRRTILLGHSLGGQACALYLARSGGSTVDGLVLVAVGLPYWRCYSGARRATVLGLTQSIGLTSAALGVWPGWGFGGRQARGVIRDWAYTARHGRFRDAALESALAQVTTPVLAVSVDDDQYTPPATTDRLCAKLTAAPVQRAHYPTAEAGGRLDHFQWVRSGGALAGRVARFATTRPV